MFSIGNVVKFQSGSSSEWVVAGMKPDEFLYLVSLNLDNRTAHTRSSMVEFVAYNVADYIGNLFERLKLYDAT